MLKNILKFGLVPSLLVLNSSAIAEAASLQIFEPINEIVGTTSDVTGGGGAENFPSSVTVLDSARFRVRSTDALDQEFAELEIVYSADNGVANNNVMIAQTSNSQGLTDTGTVSILLELDQAGGSGEFTFNWYEPNSNTPKNLGILYTAYDLDYEQEIFFDSSQAENITLDGSTVLDYTIGSNTNIFDPSPGSNSEFNEPKNAAQILTKEASSHSFSVGKTTGTGNALYMFEFRDPSTGITYNNPNTVAVPFEFSPALGILTAAGFWGSLYLKRRINLSKSNELE